MDQETKRSYVFLYKWITLAFCAGIIGAVTVRAFQKLLDTSIILLSDFSVPLFLWPIGGALISGLLIYRIQPRSAGEGIPSYIRGVRDREGDLSFSVTFFKFFAALSTLATFGNGGVVGPLGRVSSGLMSFLCRKSGFIFSRDDVRTAAICGLAAAVGAIFHSSIGAGIFAVEVIQRAKMGYRDIFPAILSSSAAVFFCKVLGWNSFYEISLPGEFISVSVFFIVLLLAVSAGFIGGLYITVYGKIARLFGRAKGRVAVKVLIGSIVAAVAGWAINPELMSTSNNLIKGILTNDFPLITGNIGSALPLAAVFLIMLVMKGLCNCITVGSGMSAGFTGPAVIMGMLLGGVFAHLFQIPPGTPTYNTLVAAGFCGVLSSSMNVPLAASIMTIEIFGLEYSLAAGFTAVIAFQITRRRTIYDLALKYTSDDDED